MKNYTHEEAIELVNAMPAKSTMLVNVKKTSTGKWHLELAEKLENGSQSINVLSLLNKNDDRFKRGGARRAWAPVDAEQLVEYFGFTQAELDQLPADEAFYCCIANPKIINDDTEIEFRIKIVETIEGTEYQNENIDTQAKRSGKEGQILTSEGFPIFSNTYVVGCLAGELPEHVLLKADQSTSSVKARVASAPSLD